MLECGGWLRDGERGCDEARMRWGMFGRQVGQVAGDGGCSGGARVRSRRRRNHAGRGGPTFNDDGGLGRHVWHTCAGGRVAAWRRRKRGTTTTWARGRRMAI